MSRRISRLVVIAAAAVLVFAAGVAAGRALPRHSGLPGCPSYGAMISLIRSGGASQEMVNMWDSGPCSLGLTPAQLGGVKRAWVYWMTGIQ